MKDLIEALTLFITLLERPDCYAPIHCEHDIFYVCGIDMDKVTAEHVRKLAKLDFYPGADEDYSIREEMFGSDFEWETVTDEQWEQIKDSLTDCFYSFRFGSC